jgi:hypothetical protein
MFETLSVLFHVVDHALFERKRRPWVSRLLPTHPAIALRAKNPILSNVPKELLPPRSGSDLAKIRQMLINEPAPPAPRYNTRMEQWEAVKSYSAARNAAIDSVIADLGSRINGRSDANTGTVFTV